MAQLTSLHLRLRIVHPVDGPGNCQVHGFDPKTKAGIGGYGATVPEAFAYFWEELQAQRNPTGEPPDEEQTPVDPDDTPEGQGEGGGH